LFKAFDSHLYQSLKESQRILRKVRYS